MAFKLKAPFETDNTPIYFREKPEGVLGVATKAGSIIINEKVEDPKQIEEIILHETDHTNKFKEFEKTNGLCHRFSVAVGEELGAVHIRHQIFGAAGCPTFGAAGCPTFGAAGCPTFVAAGCRLENVGSWMRALARQLFTSNHDELTPVFFGHIVVTNGVGVA